MNPLSRRRARRDSRRAPLERWMAPIWPHRAGVGVRAYWTFLSSWRAYSKLPRAERLRFEDVYPCIFDRTPTTPYDPHYFHQSVWAVERIIARQPAEHVDIGSEVNFVGMLSVSVPVVFVDIRPLAVELPRLQSLAGDLLSGLPFLDSSIASLSCLHVAEHIGLGRYGDRLDVDGTRRACAELARILASGGRLFFSVPVGRSRVCFNAHRIHTPMQILDYFPTLRLEEFSVVGDDHRLVRDANLRDAATLEYGCGLFVLAKP